MKTQRELNQKYWNDIHDMVESYNKEHGCDVKPWKCVRYDGALWSEMAILSEPQFDKSSARYQFAVAILYDEKEKQHRPVFPGDMVYDKLLPFGITVVDANTLERDALRFKELDWSKFSWHKPKPKRTFEINGVELPCPVQSGEWALIVDIDTFHFTSEQDRDEVSYRIRKLLIEARDKEVV